MGKGGHVPFRLNSKLYNSMAAQTTRCATTWGTGLGAQICWWPYSLCVHAEGFYSSTSPSSVCQRVAWSPPKLHEEHLGKPPLLHCTYRPLWSLSPSLSTAAVWEASRKSSSSTDILTANTAKEVTASMTHVLEMSPACLLVHRVAKGGQGTVISTDFVGSVCCNPQSCFQW